VRPGGFGTLLSAACLLLGPCTGLKSEAAAEDRATVASASSDQKLRRLMEQMRPSQGSADPKSVNTPPGVSADQLKERARLLTSGEAALARLDTAAAIQAFDQAALILHAADTEIALVRGYMQNGEYRRALAFGAHTAGSHLDVVGGSAVYAWLLHLGGQPAIAQRLLAQTQVRLPDDALLEKVSQQLASGKPRADGPLLALPARLAPYGSMQGLPPGSHISGSGLLLPGGGHALIPQALLPRDGSVWVRSPAGAMARAKVQKRFAKEGVILLALEKRLPKAPDFSIIGRDAFPGSAAFAVEHVAAPDAQPAWPVLRSGFLGGVPANRAEDESRLLGIDMPDGPRGGPVFDAGGRLVGVALTGDGKSADRLLPSSTLRRLMPEHFKAGNAPASAPQDGQAASSALRVSVDQIYETSLNNCLQVITAR
jgi:hypothetical protein